MICFNINCKKSDKRIFNSRADHNILDCRPFIQEFSSFIKEDQNPISINFQNLFINFENDPMKVLKQIYCINKSEWKDIADQIFQKIKNEILISIQQSKYQFWIRMQSLLTKADIYQQLLKTIKSKQINQQSKSLTISKLLDQYSKSIKQLNNTKLFDIDRLKTVLDQMKNNLEQLGECLFQNHRRQDTQSNDQILKKQIQKQNQMLIEQNDLVEPTSNFKNYLNANSDLLKLEQYLKQKIQNPFSKVQILAATFNTIPKGYITKDNYCSIICFLCDKTYEITCENKKQGKKVITYKLLWHLREDHLEQILLNYKKKILKSFVKELSYEQLINEITKSNFNEIQIIDRENVGASYQNYDSKKYIFEVVSQRNMHLPKGTFIVAKSNEKDSADILICFLMNELFKIRKLKIKLVTKDHYGDTLKQICQFLKLDLVVDHK